MARLEMSLFEIFFRKCKRTPKKSSAVPAEAQTGRRKRPEAYRLLRAPSWWTPSAKCDGIMVNFPLFLEKFDLSAPFRQLSWLAEGGGLMQRCMTSVLFWPSANSLPWRDGSWFKNSIIFCPTFPGKTMGSCENPKLETTRGLWELSI